MIQLSDGAYESVHHLLETSKMLHAELLRSPLWEIVKHEPVIKHWMASLAKVESQLKPEPPEDTNLYGSKV